MPPLPGRGAASAVPKAQAAAQLPPRAVWFVDLALKVCDHRAARAEQNTRFRQRARPLDRRWIDLRKPLQQQAPWIVFCVSARLISTGEVSIYRQDASECQAAIGQKESEILNILNLTSYSPEDFHLNTVRFVKINTLRLEFFPAKTYIIIEGKRVPSSR